MRDRQHHLALHHLPVRAQVHDPAVVRPAEAARHHSAADRAVHNARNWVGPRPGHSIAASARAHAHSTRAAESLHGVTGPSHCGVADCMCAGMRGACASACAWMRVCVRVCARASLCEVRVCASVRVRLRHTACGSAALLQWKTSTVDSQPTRPTPMRCRTLWRRAAGGLDGPATRADAFSCACARLCLHA